ncbi:MAG: hypothetical protein AAFV90_30005 [Cyanobacteria bacterium J06634_5]
MLTELTLGSKRLPHPKKRSEEPTEEPTEKYTTEKYTTESYTIGQFSVLNDHQHVALHLSNHSRDYLNNKPYCY